MTEFWASLGSFLHGEGALVRIAFGVSGPYITETERVPVCSHAVLLSKQMALELAEGLLEWAGQPVGSKDGVTV